MMRNLRKDVSKSNVYRKRSDKLWGFDIGSFETCDSVSETATMPVLTFHLVPFTYCMVLLIQPSKGPSLETCSTSPGQERSRPFLEPES
jgi:hypothetical protein